MTPLIKGVCVKGGEVDGEGWPGAPKGAEFTEPDIMFIPVLVAMGPPPAEVI